MTRTAVVTGGATGIGREVAARFAAEGLDVVITGRRAELLAEVAKEIGARPVAFDATDPEAVTAALAELPERVDVLVNNAGGNTDRGATPPAEGDLVALRAAWLANIEANLISVVLVTEALRPRLVDDARVVTIGSIAARRGAAGYGAAKAAVEAWTAGTAAELGKRGITVNVVSPGLIEETEFFGGTLSESRRTMLVDQTMNGRAGVPGDVAAAVEFLCSPEAGHMTGQILHVNGGAYLGR
ncbi:SDR family NAD(P)-dependent oxidoreductase [Allokutzneria oryzae]|uniref:SDR family NAD(P)-dependent oxidoreductase n=1 Tax=Allokutzneria oryzae TaxID=1378989 RepID=A0ABV6A4D8_9PSEU